MRTFSNSERLFVKVKVFVNEWRRFLNRVLGSTVVHDLILKYDGFRIAEIIGKNFFSLLTMALNSF